MRDHLFVGLLAAAFLVLNAWLGRGWIDAIGGAVAVAVFGEVAGWYIHRPRRPSRGRRSPRRTKAQRAEQPAGARRRERQDWVAEVGTGVGVIALGLALLSLPPRLRTSSIRPGSVSASCHWVSAFASSPRRLSSGIGRTDSKTAVR